MADNQKVFGILVLVAAALGLVGCEPVTGVTSAAAVGAPYAYDDALYWSEYYYRTYNDEDNSNANVDGDYDDLTLAQRDALRSEAADRVENLTPA